MITVRYYSELVESNLMYYCDVKNKARHKKLTEYKLDAAKCCNSHSTRIEVAITSQIDQTT
jgi:hypothetical protein